MGEFKRQIEVFLLLCLVFASQLAIFKSLQFIPPARAVDAPEPLDLVNTVNWFESADTIYAGMICGKTNIYDMVDCINRMTSWQDVLRWTVSCKKFGSVAENQTKIQWALDHAKMVNGLPYSGNTPSGDGFSTYDGDLLYGYYYSEIYNHNTTTWNPTTAFNNFESAFNVTHGMAGYNQPRHGFSDYISNNETYTGNNDRYYDEEAQTMRCFLIFYSFGINASNALSDAETIWNYLNANYWTGDHFSYNPSDAKFECEAGGFLQIIALLKYYDPNVGNISRLITDEQTRFLDQKWLSPQWTAYQPYNQAHVVVHEHTNNPQTRLANTLMSWAAIFGIYDFLDSTSRRDITDMLVGYSNLAPAWKLLRSTNASLFDAASNQFRWSSNAASSNVATAYGVVLSFLQCLVPINASLAIPLEELHYEYMLNWLDPELFSFSLDTRTVTISIFSEGTVEFIFNGTVYHNFCRNGTYQITFNPDWSSINATTRMGDLPSRLYLENVAFDTTPPTYADSTLGTSNALSGSLCDFSCRWQDNVGLSGFIFENNNTGTLKNETWVSFASLGLGNQWSNVSLTLNNTANVVIQWKFYVNDTSNNWNATIPPQYLTIIGRGNSMTTVIFVTTLTGGTLLAFVLYRKRRKKPK
jgi:hypothetical protein